MRKEHQMDRISLVRISKQMNLGTYELQEYEHLHHDSKSIFDLHNSQSQEEHDIQVDE